MTSAPVLPWARSAGFAGFGRLRHLGCLGLSGVPPFAELSARAGEAEVLGLAVGVCSAADLRGMKIAAGRGHDLLDVQNLDAAMDEAPVGT